MAAFPGGCREAVDHLVVVGRIVVVQGEAAGADLGAIYHSHTRTEPYPSQTDINFAANWPGVEWIIVGLDRKGEATVRTYLIEDGNVREL